MALSRRMLFALLGCAMTIPAIAAYAQSSSPMSVRLAMRGYDPVAYFTTGKPTPGSPSITHVWDGMRYQFASAAHREMFAARPSQYAPQYAGSCAASMANGATLEANPENWTIADGRLFLFAGPAGIDMLRGNPGLVASADQHWQRVVGPQSR